MYDFPGTPRDLLAGYAHMPMVRCVTVLSHINTAVNPSPFHQIITCSASNNQAYVAQHEQIYRMKTCFTFCSFSHSVSKTQNRFMCPLRGSQALLRP